MKFKLIVFMLCAASTVLAADWPREIQSPEGTITIYQPQVDSLKNNQMSARAAVSVTPASGGEPVFGAVWLDCRVLTDRPSRTVKLEDVKVKEIKFPAGTNQQTSRISASLEEEIPRLDLTLSLDELLESLETAKKENESADDLEVSPPRIIVLDRPAVLVRIDGDPVLVDVEGSTLKRVANTPFFIAQDPASGRLYLRGGETWYSAPALKGPWQQGPVPPQQVADAFEKSKSVDESAGDSAANEVRSTTGKIPDIVVATEPAELVASDGPLQFAPIKGTGLLYASNTPAKLFLQISTQEYYILISGRWYSARGVAGPWTYHASDKLPGDFAKIPPGSDRDDILADVPGTIPAKEAVLDSQIPQTAEVDRGQTSSQVEYDGDPQFQPIENTGMEYAVNTATPVIRVAGRYYDCDRGIWFESGSPLGPWSVCVAVPPAIYTIPPRCPVYYVRYVRVYSSTPTVAYVGYTAGYTGCYVFRGTVVYGTGYPYRPWVRRYYFPRPWTWGFGVHYDPWTGWSIGYSTGWWRPHGWFAYNWGVVRPGWWGPVGYRPVYRPFAGPVYRIGYHPIYRPVAYREATEGARARTIGVTRGGTLYDRWASGVRRPEAGSLSRTPVVRGGTGMRPAAGRAAAAPAAPGGTREARDVRRGAGRPSARENNVYATPNGKILRQTSRGWQQREGNGWKDAGNTPERRGVEGESQARQRGAERSSSFKKPPSERPPQPARQDDGRERKRR